MNKNFLTMKNNVGSFVQDSSSSLASLIGVWVNNRYRDIINSYDWTHLYKTQSLTLSASVSAYAFDENTDRIIHILDATNDAYLDIITEEQFLQENWDSWDTTGTPSRAFLKKDVVKAQPTSAEKIVFKSSSTADITQQLFIRGITSTGGETYETLSFNGTTNVTASNSYTHILGISKSAVTTGKATVYHNDAVTVLSELSPETLESRYKSLNVHPIPTGALSLQVRTKRRVTPLSQNYDYPVIEDVSDILELGCQADAWRYKRQFNKATVLETQYQVAKQDRIHLEVAQPGLIHLTSPSSLNRDDGIL